MDRCDLSTKVNCERLTKALHYKATIAISHSLGLSDESLFR